MERTPTVDRLCLVLLLAIAPGCPGRGGAPDAAPILGTASPSAPEAASVEGGSPEPTAEAVVEGRPAAIGPSGIEAFIATLERESWYGVYFAGRKIGHVKTFGARDGDPSRPLSLHVEMVVRFEAGPGGAQLETKVSEVRRYAPEPPYRLEETEFVQSGSAFDERRTARRSGDRMHIERVRGQAEPARREVAASAESLLSQALLAPHSPEILPAEGAVSAPLWSWDKEGDELVTVGLKGTRELMRAGVTQRIIELEVLWPSLGVPAKVLVAEGGLVLETAIGPAMVMKAEDKAIAMSGVTGLDIVSTSVPSPKRLGRAGAHDALDFEVTLTEGLSLPSDARQEVSALGPGRYRVARRRDAAPVVTPEDAAPHLEADALMDSDHPAIIAKAAELTEGLEDDAARALVIADFVHRTLDKRLATHIPVASEVLVQKVGDCTEHTWLAVALLRAAGLPARPVYGIAYASDVEGTFAYHAWLEVAIDGRWVSMDPTWGQARSDATHLKFGHDAASVAAFLEGITIEAVGPPPAQP